MPKRMLLLALACALIPVMAFAASSNSNNNSSNADVQSPTWAEHIAPLLFENCVQCHRPGQTAPMSLLSYDEARPWAKSIRRATNDGAMPPWFANPEHGEFVEDARLTEAEIAMVGDWVKAGAPAGDLSKTPTVPTFSSEWQTQPDVVVTMEPFQVTDEMEDHYQWIKVENPLDEDRWIKSIEIRPTFMAAAHHNLTYLAPADATVQSIQGAGRMEMDYLGGWAPGVVPMTYREGYGKLLPANTAIFFQMHYHKTPGEGTGGIDQTSVGFTFHDGEVENKVATLWVVDPALDIPPGEANYKSASEFVFEHDATLFNFTPHMHLRGKAMRFTATFPDGKEEILLDVPGYDFNWQLTYTPPEPLAMPAGTRIAVDAVFDNSADNVANPDPSINVTWGEKTTDEMMIGFMDYTYVEQDKQADLPTFAVPEYMKERFEKMREFQEKQRQSKESSEGATSGDD